MKYLWCPDRQQRRSSALCSYYDCTCKEYQNHLLTERTNNMKGIESPKTANVSILDDLGVEIKRLETLIVAEMAKVKGLIISGQTALEKLMAAIADEHKVSPAPPVASSSTPTTSSTTGTSDLRGNPHKLGIDSWSKRFQIPVSRISECIAAIEDSDIMPSGELTPESKGYINKSFFGKDLANSFPKEFNVPAFLAFLAREALKNLK